MGIGSAWASPPATAAGCSAGWDQLLPFSQRQQALQARGCATAEKPQGALADQMTVYERPVSHGPLGPLAAPGALREAGLPAVPARLPAAAPLRRAATDARPVALAPLIDRTARVHDIDPLLLHAIARIESRHRTGAISHAGAHGLMQVIVPTARRFGVGAAQQLHDPQTNLDVSARYLKTLQQRFGNDLTLVLAAYNAGEGAVEKHGRRIPPYRETQDYVRKVMAEYGTLRRISLRQPARRLAGADLESLL